MDHNNNNHILSLLLSLFTFVNADEDHQKRGHNESIGGPTTVAFYMRAFEREAVWSAILRS